MPTVEGDVDLTSEYFDPHAVAGLLKQFFRDLPVHIFTNELNSEFIGISDIEDHNTRVHELTRLVQLLPVVNYTALRFLSAHLVNIVKHESVNKMSVRNMGIVFSPTLGISASELHLFRHVLPSADSLSHFQLYSVCSSTNSTESSAR